MDGNANALAHVLGYRDGDANEHRPANLDPVEHADGHAYSDTHEHIVGDANGDHHPNPESDLDLFANGDSDRCEHIDQYATDRTSRSRAGDRTTRRTCRTRSVYLVERIAHCRYGQ